MVNLFRLIKLKNQDSNGNSLWQNYQKMKIALFFKPSTMKACISVFLFMFIFCQPSHASAGFFSDLVDKLVGNKTQASEIEQNGDVVHNSQNIPLLESSINPDLKSIKEDPIVVSTPNNLALSNNGNLDVDSELEKYDSSVKITTYTVKKGDTLESIAKKLKVTKATIIASNTDLKKSDLLKVGQSLVIFGIKPEVKESINKEEKALAKKDTSDTKEEKKQEVVKKQEEKEEPKQVAAPVPVVSVPVEVPPQKVIEQPIQQPEPQTPAGQPDGNIDSGYIWPFPKGIGRVSQGLHADQAYDFAAPIGTPIYAVQSGTVLIAKPTGYNGGYGRYVVINFTDGRQAIFGHMSEVVAVAGQFVKKGDIIGYVGSTGKSTGPHLHLGFHFESGSGLGNPYIGLKVNSTDFVDNE